MRVPILLVATLVSAVAPSLSRGADLQPPRPLSGAAVASTPPTGAGCPAPGPFGSRVKAHLYVRNALRDDVGPYKVTLPGYSAGKENLYRPFLVTAQPGDTLRFDLTNEFADPTAPDSGINLHTHGLIVPPRRCPPYGDSVYVEDQPGKTAKFAITIPAKLPGALFWGGGPDHPYPSGLNWFHAHVHGKARIDVMAGQSGLLQVGDTLADLKATPGLNPAAKAALDRTDVRYVALRDIQLRVGADATPDKPTSAGAVAQWLKGDAYSPGACPSQSNPPPKNPPDTPSTAIPGFCFAPDKGSAPPTSTVWMFTVNGQAFPTDRMVAGRNQLLRIANLSANVSYLLQISDDAAPDEPKAMDVVTVDGLIAGTVPAGGAGLKVGVQLKSLLLMPAGRAEIFLPAPRPGAGTMTLRTAGITTGSAGDPWPRIDLMRIEAPAPMAATPRMHAAFAPAAGRLPEIVLPRNGGASPLAKARMSPTAAAAPENCIVLPPGQAARRRITFANSEDGKEFRLGSEVVAGDGTPIDPAHTTVKPSVFPHEAMAAPQSIPHVCARYGEQEVWELINTTKELHNFHIHQGKFRLSEASDTGVPQGPLSIQDPTNIIAGYVPEAQGATPNAGVDVWHDTLPVPPAADDGRPGRVFVTIPFHARQQIGFFVFHCHILEHEDGGMMSVVQVYDPAHPDQGSERAQAEMGHVHH